MSLITCDRQTETDLNIWEKYIELDKLYYKNHNVKYIEEKSENEIIEFYSKESCYVGVSWGKDSLVLAHLVYRVNQLYNVNIPIVWIKVNPIYNPYCECVERIFLEQYNMNYEVIETNCTHSNNEWHASGTLEKGFKIAANKYGDRYISGVNKHESSIRKLSNLVHGTSTERCCRPLINWDTNAIFAYLTYYDLPIHPNYAMLLDGKYERNRIRVASLGGKRGDGIGRMLWEKTYYQDILNKINS